MKNKIIIGTLLCMAGLLLMHNFQTLPGLAMFLIGFLLMSRK